MKRILACLVLATLLCGVSFGTTTYSMTYSASRFIDPTYSVYRNSGNRLLDPEYLFANEVEGYLEGAFPSLSILESTGATYYTTFQGGDQSADLTLTLPTAYAATTGYVLSSTDAGVLSWVANAGTFAGGAITSDITFKDGEFMRPEGTTAAQTVAIQAYDIDNTAWRNVITADNHATVVPIVLGDSAASLAIVSTGLNVSTAGAVTGVATLAASDNISLANGKSLVSSTTTAQSASIKVYDNDTGPAYVNALSWTNGNTPAVVLGSANGTAAITSSDWGIDATGVATGIASVQFDSGTAIYCTTVTVSNAQCKTLFSAPKVLVAAPGTHNFIDVVSVVLFYDYATAAFNTAGNNITVEYKADASGPTATSAISQTGFLDQTADGVVKLIPVAVANQVVAAVENQPVVLYCATADPTTGGGVVRVAISYRIMPTGF